MPPSPEGDTMSPNITGHEVIEPFMREACLLRCGLQWYDYHLLNRSLSAMLPPIKTSLLR